MDWNDFSQQMRRTEARKKLIETERVVHNFMTNLESHLSGAGPEEKAAAEVETRSLPRFWLYGRTVGLVCQWCDTTLFVSPEDADFDDLEKAVQEHTCKSEREGTA